MYDLKTCIEVKTDLDNIENCLLETLALVKRAKEANNIIMNKHLNNSNIVCGNFPNKLLKNN